MDGSATAEVINPEIEDIDGKGTNTATSDDSGCPAPPRPSPALEVIGGFHVHPAASVLPHMPEDQFSRLVESIEKHGLGEPIEFKDGLLVAGRHRLRAIVILRERGVMVEVLRAEWRPFPGEVVAEYVKRKDLDRRHLSDTQQLQCLAELQVMADKERAEAGYAAGRITKGEKRNPKGRNQFKAATQAEVDGLLEPTTPSKLGADTKAKAANSAHLRLAATSGQSTHKCRQALKVQKHGTPEEIAAVKSGEKARRDVLQAIEERNEKAPGKKKPKRIDHPFEPRTDLARDLLAGWVRLCDAKVATHERAEARDLMREFFAAEEKAEKKAASKAAAAKRAAAQRKRSEEAK